MDGWTAGRPAAGLLENKANSQPTGALLSLAKIRSQDMTQTVLVNGVALMKMLRLRWILENLTLLIMRLNL